MYNLWIKVCRVICLSRTAGTLLALVLCITFEQGKAEAYMNLPINQQSQDEIKKENSDFRIDSSSRRDVHESVPQQFHYKRNVKYTSMEIPPRSTYNRTLKYYDLDIPHSDKPSGKNGINGVSKVNSEYSEIFIDKTAKEKYSTSKELQMINEKYAKMSGNGGTMQRDAVASKENSEKCKKFVEDEIFPNEKNRFYSPNYPKPYENHTDCVKIIQALPEFQIRLDFIEQFEMESSVDCKYDYLEILDGAYGFETSFGKFCGVSYPRQIISKSNNLWLRFHSDESIEGTGFVAVYDFIRANEIPPKECKIDQDGDEGLITSRNIDQARLNMTRDTNITLDCMWIINVRQNWKVQLNFTEFKLAKPNECKHNFLDVYTNDTKLTSRKKKFCGTTADLVNSEANIIHILYHVDREGITSNFTVLFTAFHDKGKDQKCAEDEFDCQDDKCIKKSLQCNNQFNCRFGGDEDCTETIDSWAQKLKQEHIIVILVVFCVILLGMCFACLFNCIRKLLHDHHVIRQHIRESRAGRLDEIGKEIDACPVSDIRGRSESSGGGSALLSHHVLRATSRDPDHRIDRDISPQISGTIAEECYVPGAGDLLPILIGANRVNPSETRLPPVPTNGDVVFLRESESARRQGTDFEDECDDLEMSSIPVPEMRDNECQTRESLFMNTSSDRSITPPPPPPPPANKRFSGSHGSSGSSHRHPPPRHPAPHYHSSSNTSAFSTFGYTRKADDANGSSQAREIPFSQSKDFSTLPPHHHHHHHHHHTDQQRFKAEAVIEMKPSDSGGARPFSVDSTKSAPDVIVTH